MDRTSWDRIVSAAGAVIAIALILVGAAGMVAAERPRAG